MAPISLIQHAVITMSDAGDEAQTSECIKEPMKVFPDKGAQILAVQDIDDEPTTDVGQSSASDASETESSSGASCGETVATRSLGKRCRFGRSSFATTPVTPSAATSAPTSPPGLSRAAMRQARDSCKPDAAKAILVGKSCRFGETAMGTVPNTPIAAAKLKALKKELGSPPGLSHTEMRRDRDACNGEAPSSTQWGGKEHGLTCNPSQRSGAHQALVRIKQEAASLKEMASFRKSGAEADTPAHTGQHCHFGNTSLGTVPAVPASEDCPQPLLPMQHAAR